MLADLLVTNIGELATTVGYSQRPQRGQELGDLAFYQDAFLAVKDGRVIAVGAMSEASRYQGPDTKVLDAAGKTVLPGFVDPHTHLVFAGWREKELAMKLAGKPYLEILAAGYGILSTVQATRSASRDELVQGALKSLDRMLLHGTTTVEAKSGYGLTTESELKQLEAAQQAGRLHPVDIVSTFLGAHAIPPEYKDYPEAFVNLVIEEMLPAVADQKLATFCDVFCEEGVFSIEQSRRILQAARQLGFKLKLHADELVPLGGAQLAAELQATSADHLLYASQEGIEAMATAGVVAVLLPGTSFTLRSAQRPNVAAMLTAGVPIALATDFNPGTCPTESMQMVLTLAWQSLGLTPAQALAASTINAAHAIGVADRVGSLELGKAADFVVYDAPNLDFVAYHFGVNLVQHVFKGGQQVVADGHFCY
ncbi:MAG: imidazolonepropionase [Firmicutes bacterium]|nr:imidazolonepropionase [Bacillota bacterium]